MSVLVVREIWRGTRTRGSALLVLLALGDYANEEGVAWPSVATLAKKVRLSERVTQQAMARLVELGEVIVLAARGRGSKNRYVVTCGGEFGPMDAVPAGTTGEKRRGVGGDTPSGLKRGESRFTLFEPKRVQIPAEKGADSRGAYKEEEPSINPQGEGGEKRGER